MKGSKKSAILDDTQPGDNKLSLISYDSEGKPSFESPDYLSLEPLKLECQHFINVIRDGRLPRTDGDNGLNVVRLLEEAEEKMRHIGAPLASGCSL